MNKWIVVLLLTWMSGLPVLAQPPESLATDIRVHDPVMIQQDSVYYLFCTGRGIGRYRSTDLTHWERLPGVFAEAPHWVIETIPGFKNHIWAPDVAYIGGRYVLFYSVSQFGKNTSCIGLASTSSLHPGAPDDAWTDHGPVICSEPGQDDWNAIDPNLIIDTENQPWLSFGSFWGGLQLFPLAADLARPLPGSDIQPIAASLRSEPDNLASPGDGAIEAPFMVRRAGWYYLFASYGYCCRGEESTYHIRVGRAKSVTGPFVDQAGQALLAGGGSLVLEGDARWAAVGHNAVVELDGQDYLICHGYDRQEEGRPKLIIRSLRWKHGWPVVGDPR
jgi:arabinan endo-1,5-alpha-L-arabinosidase